MQACGARMAIATSKSSVVQKRSVMDASMPERIEREKAA
jgi:hypothetical protein